MLSNWFSWILYAIIKQIKKNISCKATAIKQKKNKTFSSWNHVMKRMKTIGIWIASLYYTPAIT